MGVFHDNELLAFDNVSLREKLSPTPGVFLVSGETQYCTLTCNLLSSSAPSGCESYAAFPAKAEVSDNGDKRDPHRHSVYVRSTNNKSKAQLQNSNYATCPPSGIKPQFG